MQEGHGSTVIAGRWNLLIFRLVNTLMNEKLLEPRGKTSAVQSFALYTFFRAFTEFHLTGLPSRRL